MHEIRKASLSASAEADTPLVWLTGVITAALAIAATWRMTNAHTTPRTDNRRDICIAVSSFRQMSEMRKQAKPVLGIPG